MNWSDIAKNNTDIIVKQQITKPIIETPNTNIEDEYNTLYDLKFNNIIDDIYHDITEMVDRRCLHILDKRNTNSYAKFYNLIYNNTEMIVDNNDNETAAEDDADVEYQH